MINSTSSYFEGSRSYGSAADLSTSRFYNTGGMWRGKQSERKETRRERLYTKVYTAEC